jgi:hypothetical protein
LRHQHSCERTQNDDWSLFGFDEIKTEAASFCVFAFSSRELVSTSLESALGKPASANRKIARTKSVASVIPVVHTGR